MQRDEESLDGGETSTPTNARRRNRRKTRQHEKALSSRRRRRDKSEAEKLPTEQGTIPDELNEPVEEQLDVEQGEIIPAPIPKRAVGGELPQEVERFKELVQAIQQADSGQGPSTPALGADRPPMKPQQQQPWPTQPEQVGAPPMVPRLWNAPTTPDQQLPATRPSMEAAMTTTTMTTTTRSTGKAVSAPTSPRNVRIALPRPVGAAAKAQLEPKVERAKEMRESTGMLIGGQQQQQVLPQQTKVDSDPDDDDDDSSTSDSSSSSEGSVSPSPSPRPIMPHGTRPPNNRNDGTGVPSGRTGGSSPGPRKRGTPQQPPGRQPPSSAASSSLRVKKKKKATCKKTNAPKMIGKPPKFDGSGDVEEWLDTMATWKRMYVMDEPAYIAMIGSSLEGNAQAWLNKLTDLPATGSELEEELRNAFTTQDRYLRTFMKLEKLQQGPEEKARVLMQRMQRLLADCGEAASDRRQTAIFIQALRPTLRKQVLRQGARTIWDALEAAENEEKSMAEDVPEKKKKVLFSNVAAAAVESNPSMSTRNPLNSSPTIVTPPAALSALASQIEQLTANMLALTNSVQQVVQQGTARQSGPGGPRKRDVRNPEGEPMCYNCHKYGHFARDCKAPRASRGGPAAETAAGPARPASVPIDVAPGQTGQGK